MQQQAPNTVELELIQEELERLHERCDRGLVLQSEISSLLAGLDQRARSAVPENSLLFRLYDSRVRGHTDWWERTLNGYVARSDCRNIGLRIAAIREILNEIEPEFLRAEARTPAQLYFEAGEGYRARKEMYRLLRRASRDLAIADPYLDAAVFDFIEPLDRGLGLRLLTRTPKLLFLRQLEGLRGLARAVEARSNDRNHDRFILLDRNEVWHLGASINHLGAKAFMMNRINTPAERDRVVKDFEEWWATGTIL
jgi:hypothetical protein